MSKFLEIEENIIAIKCPKDTTWAYVSKNTFGSFINVNLGIKSQYFLTYGKENTTYYDPNSFCLPEGNWKFDKIENGFIILNKENE